MGIKWQCTGVEKLDNGLELLVTTATENGKITLTVKRSINKNGLNIELGDRPFVNVDYYFSDNIIINDRMISDDEISDIMAMCNIAAIEYFDSSCKINFIK